MKNLIIVLSVFLTVITVASAQTATKKEETKTTYTCPMHPEVVSMKEGECSKCGMKLVKTIKPENNTAAKGSQESGEIVTKYVCKMDGTTSEMAGKCPKCGMKMTEQEFQKAAYTCPMHSKVAGKQGDKCPKCGMEMEKKYKN